MDLVKTTVMPEGGLAFPLMDQLSISCSTFPSWHRERLVSTVVFSRRPTRRVASSTALCLRTKHARSPMADLGVEVSSVFFWVYFGDFLEGLMISYSLRL